MAKICAESAYSSVKSVTTSSRHDEQQSACRQDHESQSPHGVQPGLNDRPVIAGRLEARHLRRQRVPERALQQRNQRDLEAAVGVNGEGCGGEIMRDEIIVQVHLKALSRGPPP